MMTQHHPQHTLCYLGLGSNLANALGTPKEHIKTAIARLSTHSRINNVQSSRLYVSAPHGVTDQPEFINAVVGLETDMPPHELLAFCQSLEALAQRKRLRHWGERSLDVDILLYGQQQVNTDDLIIPHPQLCQRNFVLVPLAEVAPYLYIQDTAIADLALSQDWTGLKLLNS